MTKIFACGGPKTCIIEELGDTMGGEADIGEARRQKWGIRNGLGKDSRTANLKSYF